MKKKYALLSLYNKDGLLKFAKNIINYGFEILSTDGTFEYLNNAGIKTISVSEYTMQPAILEGKVKSLHPRIHAGIAADFAKLTHIQQLKKYGIFPIELVVVNLYPFIQTVTQKQVTIKDAISKIDIGGPTLVRSAAKNYDNVATVVSSDNYSKIISDLEKWGKITLKLRKQLATEAFRLIAEYDKAIYDFFEKKIN